MQLMEEVFFSFTFGGETLSLAAALATMEKLQRQPVVETLRRQGQKILDYLRVAIAKHGASKFLSVAGHPSWNFLIIGDAPPYSQWQIKTLYMQEVLARGILGLGTHNMSFSHTDEDLQKLFQVYDAVIPLLVNAVENRSLEAQLTCRPLEPLFKVR